MAGGDRLSVDTAAVRDIGDRLGSAGALWAHQWHGHLRHIASLEDVSTFGDDAAGTDLRKWYLEQAAAVKAGADAIGTQCWDLRSTALYAATVIDNYDDKSGKRIRQV